ncbi:MAG: hypothetical protein ABIR71_03220, partial [Chthoniobacterales bacterium]
MLVFIFVTAAEAGPRRQRKDRSVPVALQPFVFVRSAVHAVADPVVSHVTRVAMAPVRAAFSSGERVYQGDEVDEGELENEDEARPVEMAYYTS